MRGVQLQHLFTEKWRMYLISQNKWQKRKHFFLTIS